jgi:membrane protein DedA with SNARE-associated domain
LESLIETYGYWAVLLGTVLEGETVVVIAGFLAHQGYLQLKFVIFFSFLGSLIGD